MVKTATILFFALTVGQAKANPNGILKAQAMTSPSGLVYVAPNEFHNYLQFDRIDFHSQERSAVIAVGTLRAFNTAGKLKRDLLVALDYFPQIGRFNEGLAKLISEVRREEFISIIVGSIRPISTLSEFEAATLSASRGFEGPLTERQQEFLSLLSGAGEYKSEWLLSLRGFGESEPTWKTAFFSTDESYGHLQKMIREGRFYTVTADLSDTNAMGDVSDFLRKNKYIVSELDISNSPYYIKSSKRKQFMKAVAALPHLPQSRVLLTVDGSLDRIPELTKKSWTYLAPTFSEFVQDMKRASRLENPKFEKSLIDSNLLRTCEASLSRRE